MSASTIPSSADIVIDVAPVERTYHAKMPSERCGAEQVVLPRIAKLTLQIIIP
jgi:hypothetical protein